MKFKGGIVLVVVLLSGMTAFAQDFSKVEIPLLYSYMRLNPEDSNIVSGFSLNGGGGEFPFTSITSLGLKRNLMDMGAARDISSSPGALPVFALRDARLTLMPACLHIISARFLNRSVRLTSSHLSRHFLVERIPIHTGMC